MIDIGLGSIAAAVAVISATDGLGGVLGASALIGLGAALVLFSLIRVQGRWLYQHLVAWRRLRRAARRMRAAPADPAAPAPAPLVALTGGYSVETIPGPRQSSLGAVSCGGTWTVGLEILSDDLLNDDLPVPLRDLPSLLSIEGVPLAQVRLLTFAAPASGSAAPASGTSSAEPGLPRSAARVLLLCLDTRSAADALGARGGSMAALAQVLRRCVLRAEEMLATHGLTTRPIDAPSMTRLLDASLGLAPAAAGAMRPQERWAHVALGEARSIAVALGGDAEHGLAVADELLGALPGSMAASALVVADSAAGPVTTLVVRASTVPAGPVDIAARVEGAARRSGLRVDTLVGRQRDGLLLTVPLAVG